MILTKETLSAGPSIGTGEGVAHSKRWYVALVRMHHEKKVAERLDKTKKNGRIFAYYLCFCLSLRQI